MAKRTIAAVVLFGIAAVAHGVNSASPKSFTIPFKQCKLKNGLTVILSEDHVAPTLAVTICYDVGSRDEQPGHTGYAHFFEHMMFQGTGHSGPAVSAPAAPAPREVFPMVNMANTTVDRTFYWNTLRPTTSPPPCLSKRIACTFCFCQRTSCKSNGAS
jgi:hypothetical protein